MVSARWGRIVTISSAAGQQGAARQGHYSATKGGVIALTKTVALEYAAKGITANTVPPFIIDTPMLRMHQASKKLPPSETLTQAIPCRTTRDERRRWCAMCVPLFRSVRLRQRSGHRDKRRGGHLSGLCARQHVGDVLPALRRFRAIDRTNAGAPRV